MLQQKTIRVAGAQGKAPSVCSSLVAPCAASRLARRRAQAFKGGKQQRLQVKVAAAEAADAAPAAAPAPQQRRQKREASVDINTLQPGQEFQGSVVSVETFGAFIDFGASQNGLVHISQLADGYVKSVADVVKAGDGVRVKVLSVDPAKGRIALSMKGMGFKPSGAASNSPAGVADMMTMERVDADEDGAEQGDDFIQGYDVVLEGGLVFRDDALYAAASEGDASALTGASALEEGYDPENEDLELAVDDAITLAGELVTGTVVSADDMGVAVEFEHNGRKFKGMLRIEDLLVPGADVEAMEVAQGVLRTASVEGAGEDEFLYDAYEDVGGVEDASKYFKAGQEVTLYAMSDPTSEGTVQLFQFDPLADDGLVYDEDEAEVVEAENEADEMLNKLEAEARDDLGEEDMSFEALVEDDTAGLEAEVFALQSKTYPTTASSAFVNARGDIAPTPIFPNRPMRLMRDSMLSVPQSAALSAVEEDGEVYDLADYWSLEGSGKLPRSVLKKLGYRLVKDEESGEWEAAPRALKEGQADPAAGLDAADLLNWVDMNDVNQMVDDILGESTDLPPLPVAAPRPQPVVAAAAATPAPAAPAAPAAAAAPKAEAPKAEAPKAAAAPAAAPASDAAVSAGDVKALRVKTGAGMMDCKKALMECGGDADKAVEWLRQKGLSGADKKAGRVAAEGTIVRYIHPGNRLGVLLELNCETDFVAKGDAFQGLANELAMVAASCDAVCVSVDDMPGDLLEKERQTEMGKEDLASKPEGVRAKIVEGRLDKIKRNYALLEQPALRDNNKTVGEVIKETVAATGENIQVRRFIKFNLGEGLEKKSNDFAAEVAQQTQAKAPVPKKEEPKAAAPAAAPAEPAKPAVAVSAAVVKELREKSGAGMMDCKKALQENGGDMEAASEWLRKKGLASADKKSGRIAAEGGVLGYIHPGARLGVLLEVNCETDFVARSEPFLALVNGLAMQIAASPSVEYVNAADIPAEVFEAEKAVEMGREDLAAKPEAIRAKIAEGRVKKLVQERVLLDQPYLMDQAKTVGEAIKEAIAAIGENIQVRRFNRYVLGEGIEKKSSNLAEEVAAATGGKA